MVGNGEGISTDFWGDRIPTSATAVVGRQNTGLKGSEGPRIQGAKGSSAAADSSTGLTGSLTELAKSTERSVRSPGLLGRN
jgi:hypothetical protein